MARRLDDSGIWLLICDECGKNFVDPFHGEGERNFQCGAHHGVRKNKGNTEPAVDKDTKVEIGENTVKAGKL